MSNVFIKQRDTCTHAVVTTYLDTFYVQNDVTIHLNRSNERKYKQMNNIGPVVSE